MKWKNRTNMYNVCVKPLIQTMLFLLIYEELNNKLLQRYTFLSLGHQALHNNCDHYSYKQYWVEKRISWILLSEYKQKHSTELYFESETNQSGLQCLLMFAYIYYVVCRYECGYGILIHWVFIELWPFELVNIYIYSTKLVIPTLPTLFARIKWKLMYC